MSLWILCGFVDFSVSLDSSTYRLTPLIHRLSLWIHRLCTTAGFFSVDSFLIHRLFIKCFFGFIDGHFGFIDFARRRCPFKFSLDSSTYRLHSLFGFVDILFGNIDLSTLRDGVVSLNLLCFSTCTSSLIFSLASYGFVCMCVQMCVVFVVFVYM